MRQHRTAFKIESLVRIPDDAWPVLVSQGTIRERLKVAIQGVFAGTDSEFDDDVEVFTHAPMPCSYCDGTGIIP